MGAQGERRVSLARRWTALGLRLTFSGPDAHPFRGHRSLVLRAAGNDQDRAFMRDAVQHALCRDLPFETSAAIPCVVYVNGAYWGIHEIRERLDADELARRHDLKKKKFTVLEDRALVDHGDTAEAVELRRFIKAAWTWDHRAPAFVDSMERVVDLDAFFTYMAAQVILGNSDWPDQNVKYWRYTGRPDSAGVKDGRWRFVMGDSDMGLGFNGGPEVDLLAHMKTQSGPVAGLFLACMRSRALRMRFRDTVTGLLDGPLSGAAIEEAIDRQSDVLEPEMPQHIRRWRRPLGMDAWSRSVEELRTFARVRAVVVPEQLDRHLPISGRQRPGP
jgi:CotH protein